MLSSLTEPLCKYMMEVLFLDMEVHIIQDISGYVLPIKLPLGTTKPSIKPFKVEELDAHCITPLMKHDESFERSCRIILKRMQIITNLLRYKLSTV